MNREAEFLKKQFDFGCVTVEYFGDSGYITIDDDRKVRIKLDDPHTIGNFDTIVAILVSKTHGRIQSQSFAFRDYLIPSKQSLKHPNARNVSGMMYAWIYSSGPLEWYILQPESTTPIVDAICQWIDMFR
jgi:hypothetical protein